MDLAVAVRTWGGEVSKGAGEGGEGEGVRSQGGKLQCEGLRKEGAGRVLRQWTRRGTEKQ